MGAVGFLWFATLAVALASLQSVVRADNKYPIVLVHGFAGWGRDEMLGFKHWGGIQGDLQEQLKAQGHTVFTAAVGPFSSNWDRACELYAQIKGGQVDYGDNHSRKHGHKRLGRTFPGLYRQWGDVGADGQINKVHLVGHSMGGQTIRMLTQLLNKGSKGAPVEEAPATSDALFAGGRDWVASVTTISTPNQGTLLSDGSTDVADVLKTAAIGVFSAVGVAGSTSGVIYDAKLDQWGLDPKRAGESLASYVERVFASRMFQRGFQDICIFSLSSLGAAEDSTWVETLPNVYYFSYANADTHAWRDLLLRKVHVPNALTMLAPLQPLGLFLGGRFAPDHGFGEAWQPNDGVVNTISMAKDGPGLAVPYTNGIGARGKWNLMPLLDRMDHLAVIGLTLHTQIAGVYSAHARLLAAIPTTTTMGPGRRSLQDHNNTESVATEVHEAVAAVSTAAAQVQSAADVVALCQAQAHDDFSRHFCETAIAQAQEVEAAAQRDGEDGVVAVSANATAAPETQQPPPLRLRRRRG